jgi:hypothetical protein
MMYSHYILLFTTGRRSVTYYNVRLGLDRVDGLFTLLVRIVLVAIARAPTKRPVALPLRLPPERPPRPQALPMMQSLRQIPLETMTKSFRLPSGPQVSCCYCYRRHLRLHRRRRRPAGRFFLGSSSHGSPGFPFAPLGCRWCLISAPLYPVFPTVFSRSVFLTQRVRLVF